MEFTLYQIDAFASEVFTGNPAAVVPLKEWLPDDVMQKIALENNLAETAFFVPKENGPEGHYDLRWFTPGAEVDLCGHATLASAHVLYEFLGEGAEALSFHTRSGELIVRQAEDGRLQMDFPALASEELLNNQAVLDTFSAAIKQPIEKAYTSLEYLLCVLSTEEQVRAVSYVGAIEDALRDTPYWGLVITAPADAGSEFDFVSRFFAPEKGVPEDPVTGSAHCRLAPYWAKRLDKSDLVAYQASPRGGTVHCRMEGARVILSGQAVSYLKGAISI